MPDDSKPKNEVQTAIEEYRNQVQASRDALAMAVERTGHLIETVEAGKKPTRRELLLARLWAAQARTMATAVSMQAVLDLRDGQIPVISLAQTLAAGMDNQVLREIQRAKGGRR